MKRSDLTGRRYGKLTVLYSVGKKWHCRCDCGNECDVLTENLTSGHTSSCGCKRLKASIVGQRFGRLTVVAYGSSRRYCECLCDCGKKCVVRADTLKCGMTMSCDCLATEKRVESGKKIIAIANEKNIVDGVNVAAVKSALSCKNQSNNTSGHRGVCYDKSVGVYKAYIKFKGKQYYLGSSTDINKCVALRKEAEQKIFGDFIEWYEKNKH